MKLPASIKAVLRKRNRKTQATSFRATMILIATAAAGCSSSTTPMTAVPNPSATTGLPTPSAPGPVNTYNGGQSPGAWALTLDNTKNAFNYQPETFPAAATAGTLGASGGFSALSNGGLAYEVLGRAAVLRPGDSSNPRVFGVPQSSCYVITGRERFQYIALYPGTLSAGADISGNTAPFLGYGSIVASTDATGKNWQFQDLQGGVATFKNPSTGQPSSGTIVAGPASFAATCAVANGNAAISFPSTTLLDGFWSPDGNFLAPAPSTTQSTLWIGPSGFFAADQSDPTSQSNPAGASVAGMAEPASALSTSTLAAGQYLGFVYEAPVANPPPPVATDPPPPPQPAFTSPVGFGQVVAGSGSTMTGGVFPNDGVTGTPNSDIQINLGKEDANYNGLYTSVSVTVLDPNQNCANFNGSRFPIPFTTGVNPQGYVTCTFPGLAVAGNPDGKYAIFVSTYNWAVIYGGQPTEFFLFQQ